MSTDKPISDQLTEAMNQAYNKGIQHAIYTVTSNYIHGHTVVTPVLDNIINQLKKLQK